MVYKACQPVTIYISTVMVAKTMSNNRDLEQLFHTFFRANLKMAHYDTDIYLTKYAAFVHNIHAMISILD